MTIKYKTIKEIKEMISLKQISNKEIVQEVYKLIKDNDHLNAFITLNEEKSIDKAEVLDNKVSDLPLAGIPLAQKDLFCTKGLRTTCGSKILDNFVPPYSATVIENLENAGCISVGKTNMDEFAMGSSNETSNFGNVHNPWGDNLVPGGSSGGSASAVAAGIVPGASGTDTGGSIRQPASLCGITGLKPTYGRVSRWGMIAFASSLDQAGPMARTAEDCALLLNEMCSHDKKDTTSLDEHIPNFEDNLNQPLKGKKIGVVQDLDLSSLDSAVIKVYEDSLEEFVSLGADLVDISLPNLSLSVPTYYVVAPAECSSNLSRFDGVRYGHRSKKSESLESLYRESRSEGFGKEVKRRILIGTYALSAGYYDAYYLKAQKVRNLIAQDFSQAFENVDLILGPTTPDKAFKIGEKMNDPIAMYLSDVYTVSTNLAGLPAMSIPMGFKEGMPLGLQIIGNHFDEKDILKLSYLYQKETDWHRQEPRA